MTIYDLKPQFQNLLRPLVRKIYSTGITPNQITLFTCLLSIMMGLFILTYEKEVFYLFPLFFILRMALNAIDGMLAKEHNLITPLGAILNEVTDVLADGVLYFSFSRLPFISLHLLIAVIFLGAISEITGLAALLNHKPRQFQGPMGKSDRAFAFGLMAIFVSLNLNNEGFYLIYLSIMMLLLLKTIFNRTKNAI